MKQANSVHGILSSILAEHAGTRENGRVASDRTSSSYREVLFLAFDNLASLGYRLQNPRNLNEEHVKALCHHWHHEKQLSAGTLQDYLSKLRVFARWVGKGNMVKSLPTYLKGVPKEKLRARKTTEKSKSWAEAGIDVAEKIREADSYDPVFGLMLRMQVTFGLRRKEVVHNKPWKSDYGNKLVIYPGEAKGGRPRDIPIEIIEQRQVLDYVKSKFGKGDYFGWKQMQNGKPASLKYCLQRYNKCMAAIGITKNLADVVGHGLRAQFAENSALIKSLVPPTLGGTGGQMDRDDITLKRAQVSEELGHSRPSITNAYYGSFGRAVPPDEANRAKTKIEAALRYLKNNTLPPVDLDRTNDCLRLSGELTTIGVDITPKQTQALWVIHSRRFAFPWIAIKDSNLAALEAAANSLVASKARKTAKLEQQKQSALELDELFAARPDQIATGVVPPKADGAGGGAIKAQEP